MPLRSVWALRYLSALESKRGFCTPACFRPLLLPGLSPGACSLTTWPEVTHREVTALTAALQKCSQQRRSQYSSSNGFLDIPTFFPDFHDVNAFYSFLCPRYYPPYLCADSYSEKFMLLHVLSLKSHPSNQRVMNFVLVVDLVKNQ